MLSFFLKISQIIRNLTFVFCTVSVLVLSLLPPSDLPKVSLFPGADKVIHFLMYFFFSGIGCWTLRTEWKRRNYYFIAIFAVGWGVLMEILQLTMHAGRSFSVFDILANVVGVTFGILSYAFIISISEAVSQEQQKPR